MTAPPRGVALVTGGSRGIGRAIAVELARDGHDVGFCYRGDHAAAKETVRLIESLDRRAFTAALDVGDFGAVGEFVENAQEQLGPIDVAVASAGVRRDRNLALMHPDEWATVLRTNLDGAFNLARHVMFGMVKQRRGSLVLISSQIGFSGNASQTNYAAAKAGLHGLAASLVREVGRFGIRVNVVAPGFIESDMVADIPEESRKTVTKRIPLGRFGEPEHVAHAVSFLASERAAYVTGTILGVDGGLIL